MSILRVRNEDNTWSDIPAIRGQDGPQGPQGPEGPAGPAGDPGVYVGPDEPTDPDIFVWIDTSGTGVNIQDYARTEFILTKNNQTAYVPQEAYNPATKDYVDGTIATAITTTLGGEF